MTSIANREAWQATMLTLVASEVRGSAEAGYRDARNEGLMGVIGMCNEAQKRSRNCGDGATSIADRSAQQDMLASVASEARNSASTGCRDVRNEGLMHAIGMCCEAQG